MAFKASMSDIERVKGFRQSFRWCMRLMKEEANLIVLLVEMILSRWTSFGGSRIL